MPSRALGPLLDAAARELGGRVRVALVDHGQSPGLAARYTILGLPTVLLLRDGTEAQRRVGLPDLAAIREMVAAGLGG